MRGSKCIVVGDTNTDHRSLAARAIASDADYDYDDNNTDFIDVVLAARLVPVIPSSMCDRPSTHPGLAPCIASGGIVSRLPQGMQT